MRVVLVDMPPSVKALVRITAEPDGDYPTIVCNSRLTAEQNATSYNHEIMHLDNDDDCAASADEAEKRTHAKNSNIYESQQ